MKSPFQWTTEEAAVLARVAALAEGPFAARASAYDEESRFPTENYRDLFEAGVLALVVPERFGGLGVDGPAYGFCLLEMAKGCSATALTFTMHSTVLSFLDVLGTEKQKTRYFGDVVERGAIMASCTSEPGSSFRDAFVLQTRFLPISGGYRVQGVKHFSSIGEHADYYFVSGLREGSSSARDGFLSAMIPRDRPGLIIARDWNALGMRGTESGTVTYDCEVTAAEIIGQPAEALTSGLFVRFPYGYAATYLGIAEAAFAYIINSMKGTIGDDVGAHDARLQRIGEMATSIEAARLMLYRAGLALEDPISAAVVVNMAKYLGAEAAKQVTEWSIRLRGGSGILKRLPLERWYRDATAGPVMPPHDDRCLETIGKNALGLDAPTLEFQ